MNRIIGWALFSLFLALLAPHAEASCEPAEVAGGKGWPARTAFSTAGWYGYTFCVDDYSVGFRYAYGPWSAVAAASIAEINQLRSGVDAFNAAFAARLTGRQCEIDANRDLMVEDAAYWPICTAMHDAMRAEWPAPPRWLVIPLLRSVDGSRPLYPVVDGSRLDEPVRSPRAPANAPCACTKAAAIPSGTAANRWCPVASLPTNLVALCSKAP
jgi:hypothetical protein